MKYSKTKTENETMRNITIAILMIFSGSLVAQTKTEKQLSQAEMFSVSAGTLIEKQFINIGSVKGLSVQAMKLKDLNSDISRSALRFEYTFKGAYTTDTKIAVLDLDEYDGLVKSMANLTSKVFPTARELYTEVTYRSKTGFEAGAYYDVTKAKWSGYVRLEKYDANSYLPLNVDEFIQLFQIITQAKSKL